MGNQEDKYKDYQLKWFDIVMQEYNSLRAESGDSLKNQQSIINYGLTAIGVLIAFSANLWGKEQIVESIYVLFIPFLCNLIILIWNGEVRRMSRAGQYIKRLEDKIQKEFSEKYKISEPALEWETFLRKPKDVETDQEQETGKIKKFFKAIGSLFSFLIRGKEENNKIKSNYIAIIIMFGSLSIMSILLGFSHKFSSFKRESLLNGQELLNQWITIDFWWLIGYLVILLIDFLAFVYHYRFFQKVKK